MYRPISYMNIFTIMTSARATQNKLICFSKIFSYYERSEESNPSVSMMFLEEMECSHTPLVHLPRSRVVSSTGKLDLKVWLRRVLLPEAWVPKMAMVTDALGKEDSSGLDRGLVT